MNPKKLNQLLLGLEGNMRIFAKYIYQGIDYLSRGNKQDVGFQGIYSQVRKRFFDRESRKKMPYWEEFNLPDITDLLVGGLTALEQRGLIELNEENGRYKVIKR